MGGATVFAWQEGAALVLCRLAANEEREAQQAIERGGGAQVGAVCRRAERIRKAIGEEG
jgi:hypothetical protein